MLNTVLILGGIIGLYLIFVRRKNNNINNDDDDADTFITGVNSLSSNQIKLVRNPQYPDEHYWIKYGVFPTKNKPNVKVISDTISILHYLGTEVDSRNMLLYLFGCKSLIKGSGGGSIQGGPEPVELELNLICESYRDYFSAVLQGVGRYQFKLPVIVGHTYQRTVIFNLDTKPRTITYLVKDLNTNEQDHFVGTLSDDILIGPPSEIDIAVEFHDKAHLSGQPFPYKYQVTTSIPVYK